MSLRPVCHHLGTLMLLLILNMCMTWHPSGGECSVVTNDLTQIMHIMWYFANDKVFRFPFKSPPSTYNIYTVHQVSFTIREGRRLSSSLPNKISTIIKPMQIAFMTGRMFVWSSVQTTLGVLGLRRNSVLQKWYPPTEVLTKGMSYRLFLVLLPLLEERGSDMMTIQ